LFCSRRVPWSQKLRPYSYLASGFFFVENVCWGWNTFRVSIHCLFALTHSVSQFFKFFSFLLSYLKIIIIFKLLFNVIICQIPFCFENLFLLFFAKRWKVFFVKEIFCCLWWWFKGGKIGMFEVIIIGGRSKMTSSCFVRIITQSRTSSFKLYVNLH